MMDCIKKVAKRLMDLYFDKCLIPSVMCIVNHRDTVHKVSLLTSWAMTSYVSYLIGASDGFMHAYDTFEKMEHWKFTPLILVLCTHVMIAMYLYHIYTVLERGGSPATPGLFPFFVGKGFMVIRMMMAYKAGTTYSARMSFFVLQELTLIGSYLGAVMKIMPYMGVSFSHKNPRGQELALRYVVLFDLLKTLATTVMWVLWPPGFVLIPFGHIIGFGNQVMIFIIVHVGLDALQSGVTAFTGYLCPSAERCPADAHQTHRSCVLLWSIIFDCWLIERVFTNTNVEHAAKMFIKEVEDVGNGEDPEDHMDYGTIDPEDHQEYESNVPE